MMNRPPQSYQGWLSRLYSANSPEDIVTAAQQMNQQMPDKNRLRADIAVALAAKYREDKVRGEDHPMVKNTVQRKYETLAKSLLGGTISQMLAMADTINSQSHPRQ